MTGKELLMLIEDYCIVGGETLSGFGRRVMRDPSFVNDLAKKGRNPTPKTVSRIIRGMATDGPVHAERRVHGRVRVRHDEFRRVLGAAGMALSKTTAGSQNA